MLLLGSTGDVLCSASCGSFGAKTSTPKALTCDEAVGTIFARGGSFFVTSRLAVCGRLLERDELMLEEVPGREGELASAATSYPIAAALRVKPAREADDLLWEADDFMCRVRP